MLRGSDARRLRCSDAQRLGKNLKVDEEHDARDKRHGEKAGNGKGKINAVNRGL